MRIIGILMALPILLALSVPQNALAAEVELTDETKINTQIQEDIVIVDGEIYDNSNLLASAPYNFEGYKPVELTSEKKRDEFLSKYRKKVKKENFSEEQFEINASAYTAAADECGKSDGITASGLKVMEKRTLACPAEYALGTKIKIDGMGTYTCEDRGGAIKDNHFDIYMKTKSQAFAFGRKLLKAEVVM
jgi:3D (Asp-Asp-Asp) domain-containing protein